jgi:predicted HicB family RNase H-like nuclease
MKNTDIITARVSKQTKQALALLAAAQGKALQAVVIQACQEYLLRETAKVNS